MTNGTDGRDPARGEIWLAALGNARPGEPGKSRPVVIVAPDELAPYGPTELVPVIPLSRSRTSSPSRVTLTARTGMTDDSVAVCRAVRGIARNRLLSPLAVLTPQEVAQINHALSMSLGLA